MSTVAIIPARGGSKRIPRKNIRNFHGRPMIAWSIQTALDSGCFDRVIVSTDDDEITRIAKKWGAEAPFRRPAHLADDHAGTIEVMAHAVETLRAQGENPDPVCCLYATAPFVNPGDLQRGFEAFRKSGCDYAFSVARYPSPIQRAFRVTEHGRIQMFQPENFDRRSQDLEEAFHDAGQFYWSRADAWVDNVPIFSSSAAPVIMPAHRVQDIDTPEDWTRAEYLFEVIFEGIDK